MGRKSKKKRANRSTKSSANRSSSSSANSSTHRSAEHTTAPATSRVAEPTPHGAVARTTSRAANRVVVHRRPGATQTSADRSEPHTDQSVLDAYWKRNLRLTLGLLAVWFIVGYVLAIISAPTLNAYTFLGAPLGFWIAQNGAIYVFVLLILIYAVRMNNLDDEFNVGEQ